MTRVERLAIELRDQDVRNGAQHRLRRAFQDVGERNVQAAFAQPDGGVEGGEAAEAHMEGWHGRARADNAIFVLENLLQLGTHDKVSLAFSVPSDT